MDMHRTVLVIELTLTVHNALKETQRIKGKKIDFIKDNGFALFHTIPQKGRIKVGVAIFEDKIFHQIGRQHRGVANHATVFTFFLRKRGFTCSGRPKVNLESGIDMGSRFAILSNLFDNLFEFRTLYLLLNFFHIGRIHQSKVVRHILGCLCFTFVSHISKGVGEPEGRSEAEFGEEVHQMLDTVHQNIFGVTLNYRGGFGRFRITKNRGVTIVQQDFFEKLRTFTIRSSPHNIIKTIISAIVGVGALNDIRHRIAFAIERTVRTPLGNGHRFRYFHRFNSSLFFCISLFRSSLGTMIVYHILEKMQDI